MTPRIGTTSIIENVYQEICTFDSLYDAHLKARKGKRYRGEVMHFTDQLEGNLFQLERELLDGIYRVGPYRPFYVTEPKLRLVMALPYRDRIVQWAVYNQLNPFYDKTFIEDSYACRKGKGSHKAADKLQSWLRQADRKTERYYYLKLDISKYFYRVDHKILLNILSRRVKDEKLLVLLEKIINSEDQRFGLPAGVSPEDLPEDEWLWDVGMPIGNLTSQLFANVYLNELDQIAKHQLKIRRYIRYMDDVIILSKSKKQLHRWKAELEQFLNETLHLDLNSKTAIRPISLGIDFVGYRIWPTHKKLKKQTARKIIRKFKGLCRLLNRGEISRERFRRITASWSGTLEHCDSGGLRNKLNEIYIQEVLQKKESARHEPTGNAIPALFCGGNTNEPCAGAGRDH